MFIFGTLFMGFSEPVTPLMEGIIDFHNYIFFFLVLIFVFVFLIMCNVLIYFWFFFEEPDSEWDVFFRNEIFLNNRVSHGTSLEIIWTIVPALILIVIAFPSFSLLYSMDEIMFPAFTLKVIGHQWYWSYEYDDIELLYDDFSDNFSVVEEKDGSVFDMADYLTTFERINFLYMMNFLLESEVTEIQFVEDEISLMFDSYMVPESDLNLGDYRLLEVTESVVLPIETYIRILVTSVDVLHSFSVNGLGIKVDAVPGRLNQLALFLRRSGVYYGQCSELCGVSHGMMPISIRGVSLTEYLRWIIFRSN